ncbi:hrcA [Acrasis kona]|uniref:HrcA n=1 Tax=Acrasis kona TaxID=1008807 RepID=A0AAW2YLZ2_9EUKA
MPLATETNLPHTTPSPDTILHELDVGLERLVLWSVKPNNLTTILLRVSAEVGANVFIRDDMEYYGERYAQNFTVLAIDDDSTHTGSIIYLPPSDKNRTVYLQVTNFLKYTTTISVIAYPDVPIFTFETMTNLYNKTLALNSIIMAVLTIQFDSPIPPNSVGLKDAMTKFYDLYISAYDSALYVRPYERYYTFMTLNLGSMMFQTLNITEEAQPYVLDYIAKRSAYNNMTSPFYELLNEQLDVSRINFSRSRSGKFQLCTHDYSLVNVLYAGFDCTDLSTNEVHKSVLPKLVIFADVGYYTFQFCVTAGLVAYIIFQVAIIRRGKKFYFVTDSIKNPPFWQCIIPFVRNKTLTNFRL